MLLLLPATILTYKAVLVVSIRGIHRIGWIFKSLSMIVVGFGMMVTLMNHMRCPQIPHPRSYRHISFLLFPLSESVIGTTKQKGEDRPN